MNQGQYQFKISSMTYRINVVMLWSLVVLIITTIIMASVGTRLWINWAIDNKHNYIFPELTQGKEVNIEEYVLQGAMSMFLVFARILPLDMMIVITLSRQLYTFFAIE